MHTKNVSSVEGAPNLRGLRAWPPRKCRILRASEKPSPTISEGKCRSVVLSITFAALIRPWTQNRILEGVRRESLRNLFNFFCTQVRICTKDAKPLLFVLTPVRAVLKQT